MEKLQELYKQAEKELQGKKTLDHAVMTHMLAESLAVVMAAVIGGKEYLSDKDFDTLRRMAEKQLIIHCYKEQ